LLLFKDFSIFFIPNPFNSFPSTFSQNALQKPLDQGLEPRQTATPLGRSIFRRKLQISRSCRYPTAIAPPG
jgi:hypothetical protein